MIIRKNIKNISTLLIIFLLLFCTKEGAAWATQSAGIEYDSIAFDYKKVNKAELLQEADFYYHKFEQATNEAEKLHYMQLAM